MSQMFVKRAGLKETNLPLLIVKTINGHSIVLYSTVKAPCTARDRNEDL